MNTSELQLSSTTNPDVNSSSYAVLRGDVTKIDLVEALGLDPEQDYNFTLSHENGAVTGGGIALVLDEDGGFTSSRPILSEVGEFSQSRVFYFIPEITTPSSSRITSVAGSPIPSSPQARIEWPEQPTGQSGILTIDINDFGQNSFYPQYGYSAVNNTQHGTSSGNNLDSFFSAINAPRWVGNTPHHGTHKAGLDIDVVGAQEADIQRDVRYSDKHAGHSHVEVAVH